jgi:L-threonylcarbamoyladenylate synthase
MSKKNLEAVSVFKKGGVVIFPTDTVWGIGAVLEKPEAISKLYEIKKRQAGKPTAVLVGSFLQAKKLGQLNFKAVELIKKFWPGGLTVIVKATSLVPMLIQGRGGTVGLRMPNHEDLLKVLNKLKLGIAAASANMAGAPAPLKKDMIDNRLKAQADYVLTGENTGLKASTVVDLTIKPIKVLREGLVPSGKLPLDN